MPLRIRFSLKEDPRLRRALERLQRPAADELYRRALAASGRALAQTARDQFLSGQALRVVTGELRRSLLEDVPRVPSPPGLPFIEVGSELPQAPVLEFGWPGHHLAPHPYLEPAADRVVSLLPDLWARDLEAGL